LVCDVTPLIIAIDVLLGIALVLLPFVFRAGAEGRLRRGVGWYLDTRPRDELMPGQYAQIAPHQEGASSRAIHLWLIAGLALIGLAVLTWVPAGIYGLSVVIGIFGLLYVGRAWQAWRENRWLRGPRPPR
jgi:hypothetical protein